MIQFQIALHTALSHLDKRNTYMRMLIIDYSSAFNTIVLSKLINKLRTLGLNTSLCNWILDFLTGCPQVVLVGNIRHTDPQHGGPSGVRAQSHPESPSLFTHDCVAKHDSNTIIKLADNTTVVGLITDNNDTAYMEEVGDLAGWCQDNNLSLNVIKKRR